jgi:hypothetical protein
METVKFETSGLSGLNGLIKDILLFFQFVLFTKIGLAITLLCVFLALLVLSITGSLKTIGIIFTILTLIAFSIVSYLQWFKTITVKSE